MHSVEIAIHLKKFPNKISFDFGIFFFDVFSTKVIAGRKIPLNGAAPSPNDGVR